MKLLSTATLCALGLTLNACGKKDEAPQPAAPESEAQPASAEAAAEPAPADNAPAAAEPPSDESPAPAAAAEPEPLPSWWRPLFQEGQTSTWKVKETFVGLDFDSEEEEPPTKEESHGGVLKCKVSDLSVEGGQHRAAIECSGHEFKLTDAGGPMGTWVSDGKSVWIPAEDGQRHLLEFPASPAESTVMFDEDGKVTTDEAVAFASHVIKAGEEAGTWCHHRNSLVGDGNSISYCFSADRGLVRFISYGGGAAEDRRLEVSLSE